MTSQGGKGEAYTDIPSAHLDTVPRLEQPLQTSAAQSCREVEVIFHSQVENRTGGPGMVCMPVIHLNIRRLKEAKLRSYTGGQS